MSQDQITRMVLSPDISTAGIVDKFGERVVPTSRRPDGTLRKEIRIRPGFTPPEDVSKFRTARQAEAEARKLPRGSVVGKIQDQSKLSDAGKGAMSKSQKKNESRKKKRLEEKGKDVDGDVPDNWDSDEEGGGGEGGAGGEGSSEGRLGSEAGSGKGKTAVEPIPPAAPSPVAKPSQPSPSTSTPPQDPEKQLKALQKKLRQAEQLRERREKGESLLPEQQSKVDGISSLEEEISKLSLA